MGLRVLALATAAGGGDWPPLAAVISALIERGHSVQCLGDEALVRRVAGTRIAVDPLPPGRDLPRLMETRDEASGELLPLPQWTDDVLPWMLERAQAFAPDVLVSSDFTFPLGMALRLPLGAPLGVVHGTVYLGPGATRPLEADYTPSEIARRARDFAMFHNPERPELELRATDAQLDPPPTTVRGNQHWIGPLLWEPAQPTPAFLDEPGAPWVLATLSTHRQPREVELAHAALAALAGVPVRTLLTLGDDSVRDELGALPANARVERFVPHAPVLQRAALCISQAGHGLVAKSMYWGVPMVLVPWGRDQPAVAGRAEALGIARVVRRAELSPETLARATRAALADDAMRERSAAHGRRLRAENASAKACALIEALAVREVA